MRRLPPPAKPRLMQYWLHRDPWVTTSVALAVAQKRQRADPCPQRLRVPFRVRVSAASRPRARALDFAQWRVQNALSYLEANFYKRRCKVWRASTARRDSPKVSRPSHQPLGSPVEDRKIAIVGSNKIRPPTTNTSTASRPRHFEGSGGVSWVESSMWLSVLRRALHDGAATDCEQGELPVALSLFAPEMTIRSLAVSLQ